ncbi:MAG: DNA replication and repair protein RecF [Candidatus Andersenbacteria bacterium]|nr:DNA replication and repair protein RecF [Candidatus Andersenbacteria bacterium]
MKLTALSLENFRNFREVGEVGFPGQGLLVAAAPNAVGKTNFLESIYFLLRGKSFRAQTVECVQWGADFFSVKGTVSTQAGSSLLMATYDKDKKILALQENGAPASLATFYSRYPFILFLPEDTFMFARGPAARRNFLNTTLAALPHYFSALVQYHRVLRQRNAALKNATLAVDMEVWDQLLAEYAALLWDQRALFVQFLATHLPRVYKDMGGKSEHLEIRFIPGAADSKDFRTILAQSFAQESRYKHTLYGAHRDDLAVWQDGHQVQTALSRGQTRLLTIALKIVAYQYVKQVLKEEPLLLLDEVLSELDEDTQHALLDHLPATQTLLTCTKLPRELRGRSGVHMIDLRAILPPPSVQETKVATPTVAQTPVPVKA